MNKLLTVLAVLLLSTSAHAVVGTDWERPILESKMKVTERSGFGFSRVKTAKLTLTRKDNTENSTPTGMRLAYKLPGYRVDGKYHKGQLATFDLEIVEVTTDACGSTHYVAMDRSNGEEEENSSNRFFKQHHRLELVDHSTRVCEDFRPYSWEATFSSGGGFCGTSNSKMSFHGNPEAVATIATLETIE